MTKKYSLHLDAIIVIGALFFASVMANIYLIQGNSKTEKVLLDTQSELTLTQLNLATRNGELKVCIKDKDALTAAHAPQQP